jgi:hypothetical protein
MKTNSRRSAVVAPTTLLAGIAACALNLHGQVFTDPGFENYSVASGGFVQPASGPWLFGNDAGVVEPPAPNSSTGPLNTWSATFAPVAGLQYASTYAGSDTLRQLVSFSAAGDYRLSVYAAAPTGVLTIPAVGTLTLGGGEFTFTLGNAAIGSLHPVTAGTSWGLFTADFTIAAPGAYQLGIRNTLPAPYFINYDAFTLQPVPEPSTMALALVGALGVAVCWRRRIK